MAMAPQRAAAMIRAVVALLSLGCSEFSIEDKDETNIEGVVVDESFEPNPRPRVDILWVLDNTASMAEEHAYLMGRASEFLNALDAMDVSWHMGLIVTETLPEEFGVLSGNPWLLTSSMPSPAEEFEALFEVEPVQSSEGAGLAAAMMALRPDRLALENHGFRREDTSLHVIVASDEDDGSDERLFDDPVQAFADTLREDASRSGRDATLSAIVGPNPTGCTGETGTALAGERYIEIANQTAGHIESICNPDLEALAATVAEQGTPEESRFELQARPLNDSVAVWVDGQRTASGWFIDSNPPALVFDSPPSRGAFIRVRYTVAAP